MIIQPHVVKVGSSSNTYPSAKLMKTGQTTSYRTGDDGDIEAGRENSFFVLKENNPFGNTNRFTDELGGQIYTSNIVIDWSTFDGTTVLGYYRNLMASVVWDAQIDACLALSIGTYISGWRLCNFIECVNIMNFSASGVYNYAPFNINIAVYVKTSTSYSDTSYSFDILLNGGQILANQKANSGYGIAVRTFSVSGTTLT